MIFKTCTFYSALLLTTVTVVKGLNEKNNGDDFFDTTKWTQVEKRKLMKNIVAIEKVKNSMIDEKKIETKQVKQNRKMRRRKLGMGIGHTINLAQDHDITSIVNERKPDPLSDEEYYYTNAQYRNNHEPAGEVIMQSSHHHSHKAHDDNYDDDDYDDDDSHDDDESHDSEDMLYAHEHAHNHNYGYKSKGKMSRKKGGKESSKGSKSKTDTYMHNHAHVHSLSSDDGNGGGGLSNDDGNGGGGSRKCPDPDSKNLPCPPQNIGETCDKYSEKGSFKKCLDICEQSFCCIHDSRSKEVAPSCAKKEDNCPLYSPCYIIWWKLHDTVGPGPYFYVTQTDDFYDAQFDDYIETEFSDELLNQVLGHHFDDDSIGDDKFENPDSW